MSSPSYVGISFNKTCHLCQTGCFVIKYHLNVCYWNIKIVVLVVRVICPSPAYLATVSNITACIQNSFVQPDFILLG